MMLRFHTVEHARWAKLLDSSPIVSFWSVGRSYRLSDDLPHIDFMVEVGEYLFGVLINQPSGPLDKAAKELGLPLLIVRHGGLPNPEVMFIDESGEVYVGLTPENPAVMLFCLRGPINQAMQIDRKHICLEEVGLGKLKSFIDQWHKRESLKWKRKSGNA